MTNTVDNLNTLMVMGIIALGAITIYFLVETYYSIRDRSENRDR